VRRGRQLERGRPDRVRQAISRRAKSHHRHPGGQGGGQMIALTLAAAVVALPPNSHPTVSLAVRFRAGAVDHPVGKAGLTDLTARLMAEGGPLALDSKQLLRALFPMAAHIDARVDKELTTFSTTVHKDHLAKMLPIFTDVVAHPRWDENELRRLRDA